MKKENVFEGSSVQDAIEKGLAALGITEEEEQRGLLHEAQRGDNRKRKNRNRSGRR